MKSPKELEKLVGKDITVNIQLGLVNGINYLVAKGYIEGVDGDNVSIHLTEIIEAHSVPYEGGE